VESNLHLSILKRIARIWGAFAYLAQTKTIGTQISDA
jgi:hypothetical protein